MNATGVKWFERENARMSSEDGSGAGNATDARYVVGGMAFGAVFGIAVGATLDSLAVGLAVGMGTGVAVGIGAGASANDDK